jgi:phosphate/sulfate permease
VLILNSISFLYLHANLSLEMRALIIAIIVGVVILTIATVAPSPASPYLAVAGAVVAAGAALAYARRLE